MPIDFRPISCVFMGLIINIIMYCSRLFEAYILTLTLNYKKIYIIIFLLVKIKYRYGKIYNNSCTFIIINIYF